jgi:enamine deaminase RidA (YjgF/YER057c/UK114 family)
MEIYSGDPFPKPVGPYSSVAITNATSRLAFIAGQVAVDDESGVLIGIGDFRLQFAKVMENLRRALDGVGSSFEDIVYVRGHLSRQQDYLAYTEERYAFYGKECPRGAPPTTTLIVAALYHPDCLLEVDAVAVVPS